MSITHCSEVKEAFRPSAIRGSAVFTIVTSTSNMKLPRVMATRGHHLLRPLCIKNL